MWAPPKQFISCWSSNGIAGTALLLISEDLDELMSLSDRLVVIYEDALLAKCRQKVLTFVRIGLMMAGHKGGIMNLPELITELRIESRSHLPAWIGVVSAVSWRCPGIDRCGFVLRAAGATDPIATYIEIFKEGFGTPADWAAGCMLCSPARIVQRACNVFGPFSDTLVKASPIMLTGLACVYRFSE